MEMNENRISKLEVHVSTLKIDFNDIKISLKELSADMRILAVASAERTEDRKTIDRLFSTIAELKDFQEKRAEKMDSEFIRIWAKIDTVNQRLEEIEKIRLEKETQTIKEDYIESKKSSSKWFWEVVRTVSTILIALILYHFGIKQ